MKCDICNMKEGTRYLAFPEEDYLIEEAEILYICADCRPIWYKAINKELRNKYKHWRLRTTVFRSQCKERELTAEETTILEEGVEKVCFKVADIGGIKPEEDDLAI